MGTVDGWDDAVDNVGGSGVGEGSTEEVGTRVELLSVGTRCVWVPRPQMLKRSSLADCGGESGDGGVSVWSLVVGLFVLGGKNIKFLVVHLPFRRACDLRQLR